MLSNLKTTIISVIVVAVVLSTGLELFIADRVVLARDIQGHALQSYRDAREAERLLVEGRASLALAGTVNSGWLADFEALQMPDRCCAAEKAALEAALGEVVNTPVGSDPVALQGALYLLDQLDLAMSERLADQDQRVDAVFSENRPLPWLAVLVVLLVVGLAWLVLRLGVLLPIAQLLEAVRSSERGAAFNRPSSPFIPSEVVSLAESFESTLGQLRKEISSRDFELRAARDAARREAEKMSAELSELVDGSSSLIFVLDPKGRVKTWNRKVASVTGVPAQVAIGSPFEMRFLTGSDRIDFHEVFQKAVDGKACEGLRMPILTDSGQPVELLLNVTPQRAHDNSIIGVTGFGHPVGQFLEQTARQMEHQRTVHFTELASGAAHQLNQPLQTMRLYLANALNRLRSDEIDRPALNGKLRGIDEQLTRMSDIVDHLREFGRSSPPVKGGFNLFTVIERCVELNRGVFTERGIRVTLDSELTEERAEGHPLQVEKALIAVLDNAREAIAEKLPEDPRVQISLGFDGATRAVLTIEDNGGGVDEAVLPRVFDPFFTTRINTRNVGLGLSSARAVIEDLGGGVNIVSRQEKTTVKIVIPLAQGDDMEVEA